MLQQTDIASHQRRRSKSKHLPEREIPRHNGEYRAQRFIMDITPGRVRLCRLILKEPLRILGIKSTAACTFLDLFDRRLKQLSHFERDSLGKFLLLQQQE